MKIPFISRLFQTRASPKNSSWGSAYSFFFETITSGKTDPAGNIKPDKENSNERIDGAVALIMALDRAIRNENKASVYDSRGILVL